MGLCRSGNYKAAQAAFATFIKNFPNSRLVPDAKFYEGRSRYASRDFKGSIKELEGLVQSDPKNARAPDALIILAACQLEFNDVAGAKHSLNIIVNEYPNSSSTKTSKTPPKH